MPRGLEILLLIFIEYKSKKHTFCCFWPKLFVSIFLFRIPTLNYFKWLSHEWPKGTICQCTEKKNTVNILGSLMLLKCSSTLLKSMDLASNLVLTLINHWWRFHDKDSPSYESSRGPFSHSGPSIVISQLTLINFE